MKTTKKEVRDKIRAYILAAYDPAEYDGAETAADALRLDMNAIKDGRRIVTDYEAGRALAEAGEFCVYIDDARAAVKEWGADDEKDHEDGEAWAWYCHLIGREAAAIVKNHKGAKNE